MVRFEYQWLQTVVNFILDSTDEHLFINLTVGDLMWGYEDSLLKKVKGFGLPVDDKFGLFYNVRFYFFSFPLYLGSSIKWSHCLM